MYAVLDSFMRATAWPMEKPVAYGSFHLICTFVGLVLSVFFAWRLRNIGTKGNRILLTGVGIFLLICEVYKQLFYYFYMENGQYAWWIFPFQLCSVPMYLCLFVAWLKPGNIRKGLYDFMMLYNLLGGLMAFIEPSGIVHEYWTLTIHAFVWHMSLVFVGLYIIFSGRGSGQKRDYMLATKTFLVLCCVAFALNLLLRNVSGGSVNNFYIGPSNSPLAVFKYISREFGWYVSTILYIPTLCLGAYLIFLPVSLWERKKSAKKTLVLEQLQV